VVDENKRVRTDATCSGFDLLQLVSHENATNPWVRCESWNLILDWLRQVDQFRQSLTGLPSAA
jgi:hypothetical protein